jgi:DNA polymerase-3 subunit gamma/tau
LWEVARNADGALRDGISLFEQAVALGRGELGMDSVRSMFGGAGRSEMERWIVEVRERPDDASATLKSTLDLGVSPERFLDGLFPLLRDMWAFSLWGGKSFSGASLSEEEKVFLENEAPNWAPSCLKRCAMACASLFPRARLGLRSEVFSGLMLFELMTAIEGERPEPIALERAAAPEPYAAPKEPASARLPEKRAQSPRIQPMFHSGEGDIPDVINELMKEDLTLAAALINARVYRSGDAMTLDLSQTPQMAAVVLSSPRARAVLERAFGFEPGDISVAEPDAPERAGSFESPRIASAPLSSAEVISIRMGADILMSRRLDSEETTDIGGTEDEQI